jgi:hypothetical protein
MAPLASPRMARTVESTVSATPHVGYDAPRHGGASRGRERGRIPRQRLDLRDAADVLGLTVDAVRKRVKRGTLEAEKGPDGRLYVFLDTDQESDHPRSDTDRLISVLEEQLRQEREAHAEARRLLAAALERIPPQLKAPQEARESPETPVEPRLSTTGPPEAGTPAEGRPWWRRWFGG